MMMPAHLAAMPFITTRREDDCDPATCSNGKCIATGECIETVAEDMRRLGQHFDSPPLVPTQFLEVNNFTISDEPSDVWWTIDVDGRRVPTRTIVAFTGLAGSGKSTAAAHLVDHHGYQRVRFAGPLKAMMAALGLTSEQIDGSLKEMPCDLLGGKTPRYAMQTIGTEWGRDLIASDLWIRAWQTAVAKVPAGVPVVVDDCRFPNEAEAVRATGGVIIRIDRPGAGTASVHSSEQHQIEAMDSIRNTYDVANLLDHVDSFIRDLSWATAS